MAEQVAGSPHPDVLALDEFERPGAEGGSDEAYGELVSRASERLLKLTHRMIQDFPRLRRWEQTDDVFQTAAMRLYRSLSEVKPDFVRDFFGLAASSGAGGS